MGTEFSESWDPCSTSSPDALPTYLLEREELVGHCCAESHQDYRVPLDDSKPIWRKHSLFNTTHPEQLAFRVLTTSCTSQTANMDPEGQLKRKDTTKGPPLRVLSLGMSTKQDTRHNIRHILTANIVPFSLANARAARLIHRWWRSSRLFDAHHPARANAPDVR